MFPVLFILAAAVLDAQPAGQAASPAAPSQRDAECLVALRAESGREQTSRDAEQYFYRRVRSISDPEVQELVMISAEEAVLSNANRSEIASTCEALYRGLTRQQAAADLSDRPPEP